MTTLSVSYALKQAQMVAVAMFACAVTLAQAADFKILQPLGDKPMAVKKGVLPWGGYYVPSTPETIRWGSLPNADSAPVLTVPSGSVVTFDTVSHEGILEDQGKDPVRYFGQFGIKPGQVLNDAKTIAASNVEHDFAKDGPHIVTGPVEIEGAKVGDVLKVEILLQQFRVPYGVSIYHGGTLKADKRFSAGVTGSTPRSRKCLLPGREFVDNLRAVKVMNLGGLPGQRAAARSPDR